MAACSPLKRTRASSDYGINLMLADYPNSKALSGTAHSAPRFLN